MNESVKENQIIYVPVQQAIGPIEQQKDVEIDLRELFGVLWKSKLVIIACAFIFAIAGVIYSLMLPNLYQSSALLAPVQQQNQMSSLASKYGGLASLAGIDLGGGSGGDQTQLALATLQSREFITHFIHQHHLLPELMAAKKWDKSDNKIIFNSAIYNAKSNNWVGRSIGNETVSKPTDQDAYKTLSNMLSVNKDKETGFVTISINSISPYIAKQWVSWLIIDLNQWMKMKDIDSSKRNIQYLEQQLNKTSISDMQTVFYQLIESQTKKLMLAEAQNEYVFKTIDKAVVPDVKIGPRRLMIILLSFFSGLIISSLIIITKYFVCNYN
ncbi:Wzz/FepE/Etk N-terminal domain-containing protein [Dongshaea marina]|uniref:Wzz/FepE/Etk N-terminal domain-containing protein n=1 Tax=Dongshaea marina TaxID=2047966 RepID=UPI00131F3467|nr:Wzz/FepE/Etk N-terminal domain-containing protein [Dongshaea marina]